MEDRATSHRPFGQCYFVRLRPVRVVRFGGHGDHQHVSQVQCGRRPDWQRGDASCDGHMRPRCSSHVTHSPSGRVCRCGGVPPRLSVLVVVMVCSSGCDDGRARWVRQGRRRAPGRRPTRSTRAEAGRCRSFAHLDVDRVGADHDIGEWHHRRRRVPIGDCQDRQSLPDRDAHDHRERPMARLDQQMDDGAGHDRTPRRSVRPSRHPSNPGRHGYPAPARANSTASSNVSAP